MDFSIATSRWWSQFIHVYIINILYTHRYIRVRVYILYRNREWFSGHIYPMMNVDWNYYGRLQYTHFLLLIEIYFVFHRRLKEFLVAKFDDKCSCASCDAYGDDDDLVFLVRSFVHFAVLLSQIYLSSMCAMWNAAAVVSRMSDYHGALHWAGQQFIIMDNIGPFDAGR